MDFTAVSRENNPVSHKKREQLLHILMARGIPYNQHSKNTVVFLRKCKQIHKEIWCFSQKIEE